MSHDQPQSHASHDEQSISARVTSSTAEDSLERATTDVDAHRVDTAAVTTASTPAAAADTVDRYPNCFKANNTAALVVGAHSRQFWGSHIAERHALEDELLSDAGFSRDEAPVALRLAVEGIASATLILRSAFDRIGEAGGPLTVDARGRSAFLIWLQAFDRQERGLRLVGLSRKPKPVNPLDAVRQAVIEANQRQPAQTTTA